MSDFARRTATGKSAGEATTSKVNTAQMDDLVRQLARSGLEASVPALPGQPSRRPLPPPQSAPIPSTSSTAQPTLSSPGKAKKPHKSRKKPRGKQEFDEYEDEPSSPDESGDLLSRISAAPGNDLEAEILNLYGVRFLHRHFPVAHPLIPSQTQRASPEALEAREYLIQELEHIFNSGHWFFGQPHNPRRDPLLIEPFGSVRFGLATSSSDLDLCLFDPYRPNGFEKKFFRSNGEEVALPEIYDMRRIATRLKDAGFRKVLPIPFAGVPIVKFEAKIGNQVIQADINTNERFGTSFPACLASWTDASAPRRLQLPSHQRLLQSTPPRPPPQRLRQVLGASTATQRPLRLERPCHLLLLYVPHPSSLLPFLTMPLLDTLILLVLAYLQTRLVLPNLQDASLISLAGVCPSRFWTKPKKLLGKRSRVAKGVVPSTGWDTTFVESLPEEYGFVPAEIGLGELAKGFFRYYADEFVVEETVVSLARGAPFPRLRPFSDFRDTKKKVEKGERKDLGEGDMSAGERFRQSEEDAAMKAFAEEAEEREKEVVDTRASSPVTFGEFEEPQIWMQKLVVQDPFLLTRNTATNVAPDVVDLFQIVRSLLLLLPNRADEVTSRNCGELLL